MTIATLSDRRARLKFAVSEPAETETIERILRKRLRERRERRGAMARRQAEREKQAPWVDPRKLVSKGNPHDLETALKFGRVRCRFEHRGRWWQSKDVPDEMWKAVHNGTRVIGADGASRVDNEQWALRVNEKDWCKYLSHRQPETASAANEAEPLAPMLPAEIPALSSAPSPQAEQLLPPPKARTTKRTTIEEYTAFQNDYLKKYGVYASKDTEKIWAQAKGCSVRHVRDELRSQYREGLPPAEQARFQSHSKKAQPPDDGR